MKEVTILGCGHSFVDCPYDTEVWGVNEIYRKAKGRIDKIFFFDDLCHVSVPELKEQQKKGVEIISREDIAEETKQYGLQITPYPLQEIIEQFKTRYFSNSICYMIAYAIYKGCDKLKIYGADHLLSEEYFQFKWGVEYWVGRAEQAGIEVKIARDSALCTTPDNKLYGYGFKSADSLRIQEKFLIPYVPSV